METAKLFTHGGSQAVRLPKEFRFEGTEVYVRRSGQDVILSLKPGCRAQAILQALEMFEPGTELVRDQGVDQERQAWFEPSPPRNSSISKSERKPAAKRSTRRPKA